MAKPKQPIEKLEVESPGETEIQPEEEITKDTVELPVRKPPAGVSIGDLEEARDAIREITHELYRVINGSPVTRLRQLVSELMPQDRDGARKFLDKLVRLHQAAEAALHTGQEAYGRVQSQ